MKKQNKAVEEAERALAEFLENNPRAQAYQAELKTKLFHLKDPEDRLAVIMQMMSENFNKIKDLSLEVKEKIEKLGVKND